MISYYARTKDDHVEFWRAPFMTTYGYINRNKISTFFYRTSHDSRIDGRVPTIIRSVIQRYSYVYGSPSFSFPRTDGHLF